MMASRAERPCLSRGPRRSFVAIVLRRSAICASSAMSVVGRPYCDARSMGVARALAFRLSKPDRIRALFDKTDVPLSKHAIRERCPDIGDSAIGQTLHALRVSGDIVKLGSRRNATCILAAKALSWLRRRVRFASGRWGGMRLGASAGCADGGGLRS